MLYLLKTTVNIESVYTDDALLLITQLSRELAQRYHEDTSQGSANFRPTDMDVAGAFFAVARLEGVAVGCGAIRPWDENPKQIAEVKRMFVQPEARGHGISRLILACLEEAARTYGYAATILETGTRNPEAIALYERSGYTRCDCWGKYLHTSWSLCYRKALPVVTQLDETGTTVVQDDLILLLRDAVNNGASVGFLPPLDEATARSYWADIQQDVERGKRVLLVAKLDGRIVGTAQLVLTDRANGLHRAEVVRVLVHSSQRRHGIGRVLMRAIEQQARRLSRSTLVLDTRKGDPSERLYRSLGWIHAGDIPQYARNGEGGLDATALYYRLLDL